MNRSHGQNTGAGVSRRNFLKATGVAGATAALAPLVLGEEAKAPSKELNIAMIGTGTQGRVLLDQIIKAGDIRFKAICDIWPYSQGYAARLLKAYKQEVNAYTDYQELLDKEKDIQAAIVATPDWLHAEHSIACMKAGLHVYCEKEMSNDLAKAREMVLASQQTKKLLQIGHQRRSNPRYLLAKHKLLDEAKLLARITHAYGQWNRSIEASRPRGAPKSDILDEAMLRKYGYDTMERFRDWRWYKKYGSGPIADLGSHQIDIFGWFLNGKPTNVTARGGNDFLKDKGYEWYDHVMALYDFQTPQGLTRVYYQVISTSSARGYFESFMGTEGTLSISESPGACRVYAEGYLPQEGNRHPWAKWADKGYILREPETEEEKKERETKSDADAIIEAYKSPKPVAFLFKIEVEKSYHQAHLENFFAAVRGKAKLNCPGEVGYETCVQVLRANEAVAAGKTLEFKEADFKV